jgi:hypothetical protein
LALGTRQATSARNFLPLIGTRTTIDMRNMNWHPEQHILTEYT